MSQHIHEKHFSLFQNVIIYPFSLTDCQKSSLMGLPLDIWGLICIFIASHHPNPKVQPRLSTIVYYKYTPTLSLWCGDKKLFLRSSLIIIIVAIGTFGYIAHPFPSISISCVFKRLQPFPAGENASKAPLDIKFHIFLSLGNKKWDARALSLECYALSLRQLYASAVLLSPRRRTRDFCRFLFLRQARSLLLSRSGARPHFLSPSDFHLKTN